jgi:uncharacterized FlgJ-related protein
MKTTLTLFVLCLIAFSQMCAQDLAKEAALEENNLKTYVIEREVPGAGNLSAEELKSISQGSCAVLEQMGPKIQWQHSFVTGDKIYCVYKAESKELIEEHAKRGGFPSNVISEVAAVISPATAEQ